MRFLSGVAAGTMQARLESPRRTYGDAWSSHWDDSRP
jgi:hypothetical protein